MSESFSPLERYRSLVDDWGALQAALARPLPITLWIHPQRTTLAAISDLFRAEGARIHPINWLPGAFRLSGLEKPRKHWMFAAGLFHLQEEASMIPATLLEARPGERILDMCAAPGGKSLQLASRLGQRGTLVAMDLNQQRLPALGHHLERMGLTNVTLAQGDGTNLPSCAGPYHRILVDAPCSCEGTSRKNSRVLQWGKEFWSKTQTTQIALLRKAIQLVQVGGRVVYSTCSYAPEENEFVLQAILEELGTHVRLLPARLRGLRYSEGITQWENRKLDPSLRQAMRIWPHQNDTGGFFAAVLEKISHPTHWPAPSHLQGGPLLPLLDHNHHQVRPWLQSLKDRFSLDSSHFGDLGFFLDGAGCLRWVNRDHRPPLHPKPITCGLMFLRTNVHHPKIPTGSANQMAARLRLNVVELDRPQIEAFLRRENQWMDESQLRFCSKDDGFVFVRHKGHGLGQACLHRKTGGGVLVSMWPKGWQG